MERGKTKRNLGFVVCPAKDLRARDLLAKCVQAADHRRPVAILPADAAHICVVSKDISDTSRDPLAYSDAVASGCASVSVSVAASALGGAPLFQLPLTVWPPV